MCAQSYLTLCGPTDCSLSGSSVWNFSGKNTGVGCCFFLQGIFPTQGICVSQVSCIGRQILYHWATWEAHMYIKYTKIYFIYSILLRYYILKHHVVLPCYLLSRKGQSEESQRNSVGPNVGLPTVSGALAHTPRPLSLLLFPIPSSCSRKPQCLAWALGESKAPEGLTGWRRTRDL